MPVAAEYNDVDSRLLRKAVDSGLDAFLCDANEAIELKLVRNAEEIDDDETTFNPEMSHQVYGENESIFGYKDLRIKLFYSAARLTTYLNVSYSTKVKHDGVEADDIRSPLLERIPPGFLENLDDFRSSIDKEDSFVPFGEQIMAFQHDMGEGEKRFEIFKVSSVESLSNPDAFLAYHERLQTFLLWFVDASSFIDVDDPKWTFYFLYEKAMVNGKPIYYNIGYSTVYRYYAHPFKLRPRISQFLIHQPWQRKGLGAKLYTTITDDLRKDPDVLDIVVEDPSEAFVLLRDYVDCLACRSLKAFSKESLLASDKLTDDMEHEARQLLKINRRQAKRVFEILRLSVINENDKQQMKAFRLAVKGRLNQPYAAEKRKLDKCQKFLKPNELQAVMRQMKMAPSEQKEYLDNCFQELIQDYNKIVRKLEVS